MTQVAGDSVEAFFDEYPEPTASLARDLRQLIRTTLPDASEEIDRPGRVVGYSFGPGYAGLACTIMLSKAGVKLGLVGGAQLPDPFGLLKGTGKKHRYVAFETPSEIHRDGVCALILEAATRCKEQLRRSV